MTSHYVPCKKCSFEGKGFACIPTKIRGEGGHPRLRSPWCSASQSLLRRHRCPPNAQAPEDAICVKWEKYWKSKFHLSGASLLLRFLPTDLYLVGWICGVNMLSIIRYFDGKFANRQVVIWAKNFTFGIITKDIIICSFWGAATLNVPVDYEILEIKPCGFESRIWDVCS